MQNLVQVIAAGSTAAGFATACSEESLAKPRKALNELIEKAWIKLDDKIMECEGFKDMNQENCGQVTCDIARLREVDAVEGIDQKDTEIKAVEALLYWKHKLTMRSLWMVLVLPVTRKLLHLDASLWIPF